MKKIISVIMAAFITFSLSIETLAISYANQFVEYYTAGQVATARSPFHINNTDLGGDDFTLPDHRVNGPNNQPRYINYISDLHNGTDFRADSTIFIYPMFKAKVTAIVQPGTVNNGYVIVQYDVDNNGTWDNYYVKYLHILPQPGLTVGTILNTDQKIGKIDILRGNGWPPHLHLQETNSTGTTSIKLFRYFRNVQTWGYGYYLDYFAGDVIVNNSLYISVNSMDEGTNAPPTRVEFYYKRGSSGVWTQGPNMNLYQTGDSTGNYWRYWLDLKSATGASTGETIYFYLAAIRGNGTISTNYNWGLWPQYYKMPEKLPAEIIADGYNPIARVHYVE